MASSLESNIFVIFERIACMKLSFVVVSSDRKLIFGERNRVFLGLLNGKYNFPWLSVSNSITIYWLVVSFFLIICRNVSDFSAVTKRTTIC